MQAVTNHRDIRGLQIMVICKSMDHAWTGLCAMTAIVTHNEAKMLGPVKRIHMEPCIRLGVVCGDTKMKLG